MPAKTSQAFSFLQYSLKEKKGFTPKCKMLQGSVAKARMEEVTPVYKKILC